MTPPQLCKTSHDRPLGVSRGWIHGYSYECRLLDGTFLLASTKTAARHREPWLVLIAPANRGSTMYSGPEYEHGLRTIGFKEESARFQPSLIAPPLITVLHPGEDSRVQERRFTHGRDASTGTAALRVPRRTSGACALQPSVYRSGNFLHSFFTSPEPVGEQEADARD